MFLVPRLVCKVRAVRWRDGVNDRIDVHHPRDAIDLANSLRGFDGHAAQGPLELRLSSLRERIHPAKVGRCRGKERDLIDGREEIRPLGSVRDELGCSAAIIDEALQAFIREGVAAVWKSIMAKVPDRRDLAFRPRILDGPYARPVVAS